MENSTEYLYKLNTELPHDPAIPLLGTYPGKIIDFQRHMHPNVHRSTAYDSQDTGGTYVSIDRGVDKDAMKY